MERRLALTPLYKYWQLITIFLVTGLIVICLHSLDNTSVSAQNIPTGDAWQQVYQQLPDLPKENQYISRESSKVAERNTLVSRMVNYHMYIKGRSPNFRLDWKLTLADYLGVNEIIYDSSYPGNDSLKKNPLDGDRAVIKRLNRKQRNALVEALVNAFLSGR
ncbi:hypothetical protein [Calothrix sp. 336/3]|uniref:hypothetical protein n=1 Tax=Calothrix sp. 336/3 TaxID=1337936 RepID=UPI0004E45F6E|nr:hypothetical protein [Calothrix sp. 336/3]AKG20875.1 hypothetical protein IJ00_05770 [Calothrix sp. 336/3]